MGHEFQISRQTLGSHSVLALHGITSALALIAFGAVLPFHIKAGLKAWKNLISGISQLLFLAILVISALFLYYGPEELHDGSKLVHWVLGLVFFIIFIFHASNRSTRR